jgi:glycosyltransferase involved in cell wall biosynthesis
VTREVVCLSTADWDAELWTNKQHLMSRLSRAGVTVLYVDSLGLRAPSTSARDLRRIAKRLWSWRPLATIVEPGLLVDAPLVLPWPSAQRINRHLLSRRMRRNARHYHLNKPVLWTYTPTAVDVFDPDRFSSLVYHCVDDLAAYPGVDAVNFRSREAELVALADVSIASSRPLEQHLRQLGAQKVIYWPNPADVAQFLPLSTRIRPRRNRPQIGFVGAIQEHKVDTQFVVDMAHLRPDWDFVLVGPVGLGLQQSGLHEVRWPANVHFPGVVAHDELPNVLHAFDVGLIPYRINDYTRSVFPMKVFEYLAAGLGVVSTPLPSIVGEVEHVEFADSAATTIAALERVLRADLNSDSARLARAEYATAYSWGARCTEALALLDELSTQRRPS